MIESRLAICAAILVLWAAAASAEPATVTSTVNLRAGAGTDSAIVGKIPAGSRVEVTNCREWCKIEWQGKQGFAIATSLNRGAGVPARRAGAPGDPYATDVAAKGDVPMTAGPYESRDRYYGPYFWGAGPAIGASKGIGGFGFRGRW